MTKLNARSLAYPKTRSYMSSVCKICSEEFESDGSLHKHLKVHKLRVIEYYQQHHARFDMFDGKIINFRNKEQYLSTDFNSRTNLRMWIKASLPEVVRDYIYSILIKRKERKNLTYSLSQVELRSLVMPPVFIYNEIFDDYYDLCERLGFKNKYDNFSDIISSFVYDDSYKIYVDSREQKPLVFERPTEVKGLKFGDYAFSDKDATCNCYIERKSVSDLIGTLSGGYERFLREIERSVENQANLIVLVEESLSNCLNFNHLPHVYQKNTKVTPEYIFHNVREIIQKYPSVQFLFVKGRKEASRIIERIFTCGCAYKKIDLQFAYDTERL